MKSKLEVCIDSCAGIEAGIEGIPSIGFSLLDYRWNANFSDSKKFIKKIKKA